MQRPIQVWGTRDEQDVQRIANHAPAKPAAIERVQDLALQIIPEVGVKVSDVKALDAVFAELCAAKAELASTKERVAKFSEATQKKHLRPLHQKVEEIEKRYTAARDRVSMAESEASRRASLIQQLAIIVSDLDADWSVGSKSNFERICAVVRVPVGQGVTARLALWMNVDSFGDLDYIYLAPLRNDYPEGLTDAEIARVLRSRHLSPIVTLRRVERTFARELEWGFDLQAFGLRVSDMEALKAIIDISAGWVTALFDANIVNGFYLYLCAEDEVTRVLGAKERMGLSYFHSRNAPEITDGEG